MIRLSFDDLSRRVNQFPGSRGSNEGGEAQTAPGDNCHRLVSSGELELLFSTATGGNLCDDICRVHR